MFKQKILGLDMGSNSIGWALLEGEDGVPTGVIDAGCRIFNKSVEEKTPTPKNVKRRDKRLSRRVIQRRSRRKKRMQNYLIKLKLLPETLLKNPQPEIILNSLGNPYLLRTKALDHKLSPYELGRVFLHLVQRRGFLSSKKTLLGDMIDDPDVLSVLAEEDDTLSDSQRKDKEETAFKQDISEFRNTIKKADCRTLGEFLAGLDHHDCKRNRSREGRHLRTDRQMYKDELNLIWKEQLKYHDILDKNVRAEIEQIIFFQRPLRLKSGRQGNCSLEPLKKRARMGRLEVQKFRYLQDINNLQYRLHGEYKWISLEKDQRKSLVDLFEHVQSSSFRKIRTALKLKGAQFNLETDVKKLNGNTTAVKIRNILPDWDEWPGDRQSALVEDLITIMKKSVLNKRLTGHWGFSLKTAVQLCLVELEPGHNNLSSKAIKKLLPFLEQGQIYSEARISAGYGYEIKKTDERDRLGPPPEIPNPIVSKGLHELRRIVNAIIAHHGKPDIIRIEMARDLEMNTQKYKKFKKQQKANTKANDEAVNKYREMRDQNPHLHLSAYPSRDEKLRYRLWKEQDGRCAYSNISIMLPTLFSSEAEIDHIIPYSLSLNDSYMNKVVCLSTENRYKGQRTPIDAFGGNKKKWNQITEAVENWPKNLRSKKDRFHFTAEDIVERDFISSQLNDTRYICKEALTYLNQLGNEVTTTKGFLVSWMRHMWGLNSLIGKTDHKERTDHRHHTLDAVVIACIDRKFHTTLVKAAKIIEQNQLELKTRKLPIPLPWETIRTDTDLVLKKLIVSHAPQKKVSGELHEETGAGFIKGLGNVYRKDLDGKFTVGKAKDIIDPEVKEIVVKHLSKFDNKPKDAFAQGETVYHKDGKTPIKRVRIIQSKTNLKKLEKRKFGVRNKQGDIFKWMPYGNLHHVEIIKNKDTETYSGVFVTMMEARRRAMTNTKRAHKKRINPESIIKINHGPETQFITALCKKDLVSITYKKGERRIYRVQKLDGPPNNRIRLRLHTAATDKNNAETLPDRESTIPALIKKKMKRINVNVLGKLLDD
ncbi:MAG: type II CRISPR RNA-guided endonuclease Cas9 [Deltaproteobacteria bacterium]|nr:type II CRISPR RNA-guided endonuclease Cas9 [Deltaproteobacteria bacterium]